MNSNDREERLRRDFAALREREEQQAPPFEPLWQRASTSAAGRSVSATPWLLLSVAGASALGAFVVIVSIGVVANSSRLPDRPRTVRVEKAPLEFLLHTTPGRSTVGGTPDFDSDLVAGLTRSVPAGLE